MLPFPKIFAYVSDAPIKGLPDPYGLAVFKSLLENDHRQLVKAGAKRITTTDIKVDGGKIVSRTVGDADWEDRGEHVYLIPRLSLEISEKQTGFIRATYGEGITSYVETNVRNLEGLAWCTTKQCVVKRVAGPADTVMRYSGNVIYCQHYLEDIADNSLVMVPASFENRHLPQFERSKTKADYVLTSARTWTFFGDTIIAHLPDHKMTRRPHPNIRPLFAKVVKTAKRGGISYNDVHLTDVADGNKPVDIFQILLGQKELKFLKTQNNKREMVMPYQLDKVTTIAGIDALDTPDWYDRAAELRNQKSSA